MVHYSDKATRGNDINSTSSSPSEPKPTVNTAVVKHLIAEFIGKKTAPSFAFVFGIDHSCDGTFVDGIFTRIPFGVHLLLLKLGELSPVVDDHQQFPDEQQG